MVNKYKLSGGFTLIELLISIGVLGVALTLTAGVLLSVIRSSQRQKVIAEVERNGDFVMSYIEKMVTRAPSVECKSLAGITSICNSANASELNIGQGQLFIGLKQGPQFNCSTGAQVTNSFVYATSDDASLTSTSDAVKLSNDTENGVNISSLTFDISAGNPSHVAVTMTVEDSNCSSWNISKQFQSFITVRGTY